MDLDAIFLGTGGSVPTARRGTASLLVRRGGDRLLFDCGEGTQRQMQRSTGLVQLDRIFFTHYHADHWLGLPGLLKTYDLQGRERPLALAGPPGLGELLGALRRLIGGVSYGLDVAEMAEGEAVRLDGYEVRSFGVEHRARAYGYALVEDERPGRFDPGAAERLGVEPGPAFGSLQRGEAVEGRDGAVRPEQVMGESRPGRKLVVTGDTAPCEMTRLAAHRAELLVHDGSFADEESDRAAETGHSTARAAARLAREAEVRFLALVHVSSRYNVSSVVAQAREEFAAAEAPRDFDVVEIPYAERGAPALVQGGAQRRSREAPEARPAAAEQGAPGLGAPE